MDLSSNDIRVYEFATQLRGYDKDDVDQFRDQVAEAVETLKQEAIRLSMELESVKGQLSGLREFEDAIKSAAIDARRNADRTIKGAKEEAQKLLSEARDEAERTIQFQKRQITAIQKQLSRAQETRTSYFDQFRNLLQSHLEMLDAVEKSETSAIAKDDKISVTESSEVQESHREKLVSSRDSRQSEAAENATMTDSSEAPMDYDQLNDTDKLKEVLSEPEGREVPNIDPELAAALQQYKKAAHEEGPVDHFPEPRIPKPGEFVETTAKAEDVPKGFIAGNNEGSGSESGNDKVEVFEENPMAPEAQDSPTEHNTLDIDTQTEKRPGEIDLATELDSVAAKFVEEMDKAEKS